MTRYERYKQFCLMVDVMPMPLDRWTQFTDTVFSRWPSGVVPKSWRFYLSGPKKRNQVAKGSQVVECL